MLDPTLFDRFTMGFALAIHIVLAVIGIALPATIAIAEYLGIKNNDNYYRTLAKRLTVAFVIVFAIGTASGMLVAANLLFLWPGFMALASQVAILPVYLEVFVFFGESIFLALYVYSGKYFENSYKHVYIMVFIAFCAMASGALITILNSFMNTPVGFNIATYLQNGQVTNINPIATFFAPAAMIEVPHVVATSYFVGASILLAYFSYMYLKSKEDKIKIYYQKAIRIAFAITLVGMALSLITGVLSIESLYHLQPEKYAAIELNFVSEPFAPEIIGGIAASNNTVQDGIAIPDLQSDLAGGGNASTVVPGLDQYPQSTWPPLFIHDMFDFMVGVGVISGVFLFIVFVTGYFRKNVLENPKILKLFIVSGAFAVILLENGWMVDEFGRQPWIIYNVMLVSQAANQSQSIIPIAIAIVVLYAVLIPFTLIILKRIFSKRPLMKEL